MPDQNIYILMFVMYYKKLIYVINKINLYNNITHAYKQNKY